MTALTTVFAVACAQIKGRVVSKWSRSDHSGTRSDERFASKKASWSSRMLRKALRMSCGCVRCGTRYTSPGTPRRAPLSHRAVGEVQDVAPQDRRTLVVQVRQIPEVDTPRQASREVREGHFHGRTEHTLER
jgi:hypothetical protein